MMEAIIPHSFLCLIVVATLAGCYVASQEPIMIIVAAPLVACYGAWFYLLVREFRSSDVDVR